MRCSRVPEPKEALGQFCQAVDRQQALCRELERAIQDEHQDLMAAMWRHYPAFGVGTLRSLVREGLATTDRGPAYFPALQQRYCIFFAAVLPRKIARQPQHGGSSSPSTGRPRGMSRGPPRHHPAVEDRPGRRRRRGPGLPRLDRLSGRRREGLYGAPGTRCRRFLGAQPAIGLPNIGGRRGASLFKMMDVSRHKSVDTLRGYVRDADAFRGHAGAGLL
jgi:hypothetical protein